MVYEPQQIPPCCCYSYTLLCNNTINRYVRNTKLTIECFQCNDKCMSLGLKKKKKRSSVRVQGDQKWSLSAILCVIETTTPWKV